MPIRALITGGPGSGCTTTAAWIAERLGLIHFDSDHYFHKPTDPPFQEQYSPEERRGLITRELHTRSESPWILSGSVATWGLDLSGLGLTHGIILDVGCAERLKRLALRERARFGARLDPGGDLHAEHLDFMEWARGYETRTDHGRNFGTDRQFVVASCPEVLHIHENLSHEATCGRVLEFLTVSLESV